MMQAILEGVALRTAKVLAAIAELCPFAGPISVDSGLSRNDCFVRFLSEVTGHHLILAAVTEQTAMGLPGWRLEAWGRFAPKDSAERQFQRPIGTGLRAWELLLQHGKW